MPRIRGNEAISAHARHRGHRLVLGWSLGADSTWQGGLAMAVAATDTVWLVPLPRRVQ